MNKFDIEQTSFLKSANLKKGLNAAYEFEGKFYVVKVTDVLEPMRKEYSEAKGVATSDYQNFLEKTWLEELTKNHPIKVNSEVLYNLGNK
jgi:peptidyl-prolyl cis-trans isomerase SurA